MHPIKFTLLTLTLFLLSATAMGQSRQVDSLETLLKNHKKEDARRVDLLNELSVQIHPSDLAKGEEYARQSLQLCARIDYPKGKAAGLRAMGIALQGRSPEKALDYFREALEIVTRIGDKVGMCNNLLGIGNCFKLQHDYKTCEDYYTRAFDLAQKIDDKRSILLIRIAFAGFKQALGYLEESGMHLQEALKIVDQVDDQYLRMTLYYHLGGNYVFQGNFPPALEYFLLALEVSEKSHNNSYIFYCLYNICGIQSDQGDFDAACETLGKALNQAVEEKDPKRISLCYNSLGNIYDRIGRPEALEYFEKSLAISKGKSIGLDINNLTCQGRIYTSNGAFEKARQSLDEAVALGRKFKNPKMLSTSCLAMGVLDFTERRYGAATANAREALELARQTQYTEVRKDSHKLLSDIQAATGDYKSAYTNYVEYKALSDTLTREADVRKVAMLESSYKFAKEREVFELEKAADELSIRNQRQTILLLVAISLLVLVLAAAIYWFGRMRKKVLQLEIENINRELEANQKAMAVAQLKLVQTAERDAQTVRALMQIEESTDKTGQQRVGSLINDYKLQSNQSNWDEFETLFTKVNASFWEKLNALYPDLTPNERKLCAFLKLNMNNKDIALITLQSEEALKKSRLRLRSKLNLEQGSNLTAFIQGL